MTNAKGYVYEVKDSGRGEFHTWDVIRRSDSGGGGLVVASYKWKFIAEQSANILSGADDRDAFVDSIVSSQADPADRDKDEGWS